MMANDKLKAPAKLLNLVAVAVEEQWSFRVVHRKDTGGHPFIMVTLVRDDDLIEATWHTGDTGTLRWWGAVVNNSRTDFTLSKVMEIMRERPSYAVACIGGCGKVYDLPEANPAYVCRRCMTMGRS